MKAKEYYEKYGVDLLTEEHHADLEGETKVLTRLLIAFIEETMAILRTRRCERLDATQAVVVEQNDKWNAIIRIFEKGNAASPLTRDGFLHYAEKTLPQLFPDKPIPKEYPQPQLKKEKEPPTETLNKKEYKNVKFV